MNIQSRLLLALSLCAVPISHASEWFVRPTLYLVSPTNSGHAIITSSGSSGTVIDVSHIETLSNTAQLSSTGGTIVVSPGEYANRGATGFALGTRLGGQHEISAECFGASWEASFGDSWYQYKRTDRIRPLLVNYRYHLATPVQNLEVYGGPSLGMSLVTQDTYLKSGSYLTTNHTSDVVAAYSASVGVLYTVYKNIDIDAGYRYLYSDHSHLDYLGTHFTYPSLHANLLYVGANLRF